QFENTASLLGTVELAQGDERSAVAVVHAFVENQGDAWSVTGAYLDRFVEEQRLLTPESPSESDEQAAYLRWMVQTGRRLAEMQLALASHSEIDDFRPVPIEPHDVRTWSEGVLTRAGRVFEDLVRRHAQLKETDQRMADSLLAYRDTLAARLGQVLPEHVDARKIRHHGDFHLGQMLIVKDDVYIIDFE